MNNSDKKELEDLYISILQENIQLLSEMIVIGDVDRDYYVIAYESKIWRLDALISKIQDDVLEDIKNIFGYSITKHDNFDNISRMISTMNYGNNEILFGEMSNGKLLIKDKTFSMIKSPQESILFKKVVETLRPTSITFESGRLDSLERAHFNKSNYTDKTYFHGTSSDKLVPIIKMGLDKDTANSNYPQAVKDIIKGRIFITSNFEYALSHAVRTALKDDAYPVVIEFRVRFEDLLQPDYDVRRTSENDQKALKISREMGIYGYAGNIIPQDFKDVYYSHERYFNADQYSNDQIEKIDAQTLHWLITTKGVNFQNMDEYI
jgi:hypothetical protein